MIKVTNPTAPKIIVSSATPTTTVKVKPTDTVTAHVPANERFVVGVKAIGPAGRDGIVEEEMTYSKRVDFVDENVIYRGEAAVGTSNSDAKWRIRRINIGTDNDVSEEWAEGSASFAFIWDQRATYAYS